jgi:hypothetical protein
VYAGLQVEMVQTVRERRTGKNANIIVSLPFGSNNLMLTGAQDFYKSCKPPYSSLVLVITISVVLDYFQLISIGK